MARSLALTNLARLTWSLTNPLDLSTPTDSQTLNISKAFTSGTGLDQADRIFHDQYTLATTVSMTLDLYDFAVDAGAAGVDPLGVAITLAKVKGIIVYNTTTTAGEKLKFMAEGTAAAWNSFFQVTGTASDTAGCLLGPGGLVVIMDPSLAAYAVTDTSNHLIKFTNAASGSVVFDVLVWGTSA